MSALARAGFDLGPSIIYTQSPVPQNAAVQSFDCFGRLVLVCHFYESDTARQPTLTIPDDIDVLDLSVLFEELFKLFLSCLNIQVPNKDTFHAIFHEFCLGPAGRSGTLLSTLHSRYAEDPL
jgi:hypothetical protein